MGWHWKCQPSEKIVDFRDGEEGEFPSRENTVFEMARRESSRAEKIRFSRWRGGRVPEPENTIFEMARSESSRAGKILTNIDRIKEIRDGR